MHGWKWNAKYWNALFVTKQQCFPFLLTTLEQLVVRSSAAAFFSFHLVAKLFYTFLTYLDIPSLRPLSSSNYIWKSCCKTHCKNSQRDQNQLPVKVLPEGPSRVLTQKVGEHGEEDSTQNLEEPDCHLCSKKGLLVGVWYTSLCNVFNLLLKYVERDRMPLIQKRQESHKDVQL